jgi:hypothetical protein
MSTWISRITRIFRFFDSMQIEVVSIYSFAKFPVMKLQTISGQTATENSLVFARFTLFTFL